MTLYPPTPTHRALLLAHRLPLALLAYDALQLLLPIALVVSPCLAAFTFMSSVMGSLAHEPVWLSLMHAALIVEMPLVIACTVENRFLQQPKPPPTLASLTLTRTLLLHLLTALLLLTSLTALLSRPSCAPGSPWLESLRPAVVNQGEEETEVMRANCTESLVAVGLTLGNTALCLCPLTCTLVVRLALWRIGDPVQVYQPAATTTAGGRYAVLPQQVPC